MNESPANFQLVDPQLYPEFNYLVKHAKTVISHSGGIREETTVVLGDAAALRDSTNCPEAVTIGTNELIGTNPAALVPALDKLFAGQWEKGAIPEKWYGLTGERILQVLEQLLAHTPKRAL